MRRRELIMAAGVTGLSLLVLSPEIGQAAIGKTFSEIASVRRSIRMYTDEPISKEVLERIIETSLLAPTSWGEKVVEFVVVENKETLKKLAACKKIGAPSVAIATAAVVVLANRDRSKLWVEDASVAATYVLLAAEEQGIGACWNQIRDREGQNASAAEEIRQLLSIPKNYGVLCVIALGHKGEEKKSRRLEEMPKKNIHWGSF